MHREVPDHVDVVLEQLQIDAGRVVVIKIAQLAGLDQVMDGYWGPNLVRNFCDVPGARVAAVCDARPERLEIVQSRYPGVETTTEYDEVLSNKKIDAVIIATPVSTHYPFASKAFKAGKPRLGRKADDRLRRRRCAADRRGREGRVYHECDPAVAVREKNQLIDRAGLTEHDGDGRNAPYAP